MACTKMGLGREVKDMDTGDLVLECGRGKSDMRGAWSPRMRREGRSSQIDLDGGGDGDSLGAGNLVNTGSLYVVRRWLGLDGSRGSRFRHIYL